MNEAPQNLLEQWARLLLGALAQGGVTDVVVSPGSRSTPFLAAALRQPSLRCHDVADERSAGFVALGMAKATGRAPLLLCTSGSAGAHYLPAVIEAAQAFVPLLVLTADRPFELHDCGANQTVEQTRLFGVHARASFELGLPDGSAGALRRLRHLAAQAVALATWPTPGAVHLNARARKPLEPAEATAAASPGAAALEKEVSELLAAPAVRVPPPRVAPDAHAVSELAQACAAARRGLIVAGPARPGEAASAEDVASLAALTGFPVLCEAASQLRLAGEPPSTACDGFDWLCRSPRFRGGHPPDLILQLHHPLTSSGWETFLAAHPGAARYVLAEHGWNDPQSNARMHLFAPVGESVRALCEGLRARRGPAEPSAWQAEWTRANALAWKAVGEEGAGFRTVVGALPPQSALFLGNSLPIREVDLFCPARAVGCAVFSQRGASGIDGLISGAAGVALSGRSTCLLLGDVSFLHDVGGLAVARQLRTPLVIVAVNNDGGRIFEQLPLAKSGLPLEHWTTPHGSSPAALATAFGLRSERVDSVTRLEDALRAAFAHRGCSVIEWVEPPHAAAERLSSVAARLEDRL